MAAFMIDDMPRLATIVGQITVNWSGVDLQLALLLGSLLGVENEASVAVFISLRNHRAQRDALQAAAEKCLSTDLKEGFDALLAGHSRLDKQRNEVVHGLWGRAEKTPDDLIWCSLQDHANMLIRDYQALRPGAPSKAGYDRTGSITRDCFVVRYKDLEELNREVRLLAEAACSFHVHLRYGSEPSGDNARKQFFSNAVIAAELAQRKKKHLGLRHLESPDEFSAKA